MADWKLCESQVTLEMKDWEGVHTQIPNSSVVTFTASTVIRSQDADYLSVEVKCYNPMFDGLCHSNGSPKLCTSDRPFGRMGASIIKRKDILHGNDHNPAAEVASLFFDQSSGKLIDGFATKVGYFGASTPAERERKWRDRVLDGGEIMIIENVDVDEDCKRKSVEEALLAATIITLDSQYMSVGICFAKAIEKKASETDP